MELANGATVIFLNAKGINGEVHSDIKNLLDFINGKKAQGKFTENIETKVEEVKRNDRLKVSYMSGYAEEMRIRRIAFAEGEENKTLSMIKNLFSEKASIDFISRVTGWTKEKILEFAKSEGIETPELNA